MGKTKKSVPGKRQGQGFIKAKARKLCSDTGKKIFVLKGWLSGVFFKVSSDRYLEFLADVLDAFLRKI